MSRLLRLILLILLVLFLLFVGFRCSQLAKEHGAQNLAYTIVPSKDNTDNQQNMGLSALRHNGSNTNDAAQNTDQNVDQNVNITLESDTDTDSNMNVDIHADTDNADTEVDSDMQQNDDGMDTETESITDDDSNDTNNLTDASQNDTDLVDNETNDTKNTLVSEQGLTTGELPHPSEVDRSPGDMVAAEASAKAKNMLTSDDDSNSDTNTNNDSNGNDVSDDASNESDADDSTANTAQQTEVETKPATAQAVEISNDSMKKGSAIILQNVTFGTGSSRLANSSFKELDKVVTILNENPDITLEIAGFTDNRGSDAGNKRVSLQRADAVRSHLVNKGIAADRLITQGYGPANPIADNKTSAGRKKNRRVEIYVK